MSNSMVVFIIEIMNNIEYLLVCNFIMQNLI